MDEFTINPFDIIVKGIIEGIIIDLYFLTMFYPPLHNTKTTITYVFIIYS